MTEDAFAFVTGPESVADFTGDAVSRDELGGAACTTGAPVSRRSSCATRRPRATRSSRSSRTSPTITSPIRRAGRPTTTRRPRLRASRPTRCPSAPTASYDVRVVIDDVARRRLVPRAARRSYAPNLVTGSRRSTGGRSASSRTSRCTAPGTLDIEASRKAARFVAWCDTSTCRSSRSSTRPASSRAATSNGAGMIRHGAELVHAYAAATVPRLLRRDAQGVRRRVHRHGLARHRQRPLRRVAGRRDRGDGRPARGADPARQAAARRRPEPRRRRGRARRRVRGRVRQPVPRRRARPRRRGDRTRADPARARATRSRCSRRSATASRRGAIRNTPL